MPAKYKKRPDGRYLTQITIGVDDNGKPIIKNIYAKTIKELEEKAAAMKLQYKTGTLTSNKKITVGEWADEWLSVYKVGVAYNTKLMYDMVVRAHIKPVLGQMLIIDVRQSHIQKLLNEKSNTRTAEKIYLTLNQLFKKAVENNFIIKNPVDNVEKPKYNKPKKRSLTMTELNIIKTAELPLKSKVFLYVLLHTGLRRGEALALTKSDIDLKEKTISVSKTHITKGNTPEIKLSPKTEAGNRIIPLPDVLLTVLNEYIPTLEGDIIFPSEDGKIMSKRVYRTFWRGIVKQLNIAAKNENSENNISIDITPHIFRHTYATNLYYADVDIKSAQYLLGHSSIAVTMEVYTHLDKTKTKNAAQKLNELYESQSKNSQLNDKTR